MDSECSLCEHLLMNEKRRTEFVQALARGLDVINAFSREEAEMTLTDVAKKVGLTRAASRRFLLTLTQLGYMQTDGRRFRLTPKVLSLGQAYLSSSNLWDVAEPFLENVSRQLRESSSLSVLDGTDVVYVGRVPTERIMSISLGVGARLPAYCTSMGRVLLAHLEPEALNTYLHNACLEPRTEHTETSPTRIREIIDEVRQEDYAIVNQELEIGLRSCAVPVRRKTGQVIAAMNVGVHAQRVTMGQLVDDYLPVLRRTADDLQMVLAR